MTTRGDHHVDFRLALRPVAARRTGSPLPSPPTPATTHPSPPTDPQWHDIKTLLETIEAQTKQTGVDVGELWERSKHNNLSLQRLVAEIAEYSNEVTTEGNATKQDIHDLIAKFDQLRAEVIADGDVNDIGAQLLRLTQAVDKLSHHQLREALLHDEIDKQKQIIASQAATIAAFELKLRLLQALEHRYQGLAEDYRAKYADLESLRRQYVLLKQEISQLDQLIPEQPPLSALNGAYAELEDVANTSFSG